MPQPPLAEKLQLPVAVTGPAKAVIDETFDHYAGVYNGKGSAPETREAIEASDQSHRRFRPRGPQHRRGAQLQPA